MTDSETEAARLTRETNEFQRSYREDRAALEPYRQAGVAAVQSLRRSRPSRSGDA